MRLLDAEDFTGLGLRESPLLDEPVNLQRQIGLEPLALGIRESEIAKDIVTAVLHPNAGRLLGHREVCLSLFRSSTSSGRRAARRSRRESARCTPPGTCPCGATRRSRAPSDGL